MDMNVVYNSENYYVVEYPTQKSYEVVDKLAARSGYIDGGLAEGFIAGLKGAIQEEASSENVDGFIGDNYDSMLNQPVTFH